MTGDDTLNAFRLADSFLPTGAYTISYGLEQFIQDDRVTGAADLEALLRTYLHRQIGPADLVALRVARTAADTAEFERVCEADRRLTTVTMAAEFRESSEQSGDRLLSLQRELCETELVERYARQVKQNTLPGNHPVALGVVTAEAGIDEQQACLIFCHSFVTGLLGAAQRLLSLGHTDAQRILTDLQPAMIEAVEDSAERSLSEMTPFTPLVDVLAADHERAARRLFGS